MNIKMRVKEHIFTSSGTQGGAVSLTDCLVSFLVGLAFTGAGGGKREGGSSCSSSREGCSREEVEAEK